MIHLGEVWSEAKILIVDDLEANVRLLRRLLERAGYRDLHSANDGEAALELARQIGPDLVLLDLHLPRMQGSEVLDALKGMTPEEGYLPVLVLTADANPATKRQLLAAGAMDFIAKPFDMDEVLLRSRNLLHSRYLHLHMEAQVAERTAWLQAAQQETLERLVRAGEFRDDDTGHHARRVGDLAAHIARALGRPAREVELIRRAAPLHDVGKIAVSDNVLLKPGMLTEQEWEQMKRHTVAGARILERSPVELMQVAERIALCHHERWDGNGYPNRLKGEDIPLVARIVAVADVFDALTHDRPYRRAKSREEAVNELRRVSGSQLDPTIVTVFLEMLATDDREEGVEGEQVQILGAAHPVEGGSLGARRGLTR